AKNVDPLNPAPLVTFADWSRELGLLHQGVAYGDESIKFLKDTRALDPLNTEIIAAEFEVRLQYTALCYRLRDRHLAEAGRQAAEAKKLPAEAERFLAEEKKQRTLAEGDAAEADRQLQDAKQFADDLGKRDPAASARLHYRLAEVCFKANEPG